MSPARLTILQFIVLMLPAALGTLAVAMILRGGVEARFAWAIATIVGLSYTIIVPTLAAEIVGEARAVHSALRARARSLGIVLSTRVNRRGVAETVAVAAIAGTCPLGFQPGDRWQVSKGGRMNRPLCVRAISSLNARRPSGSGQFEVVKCVCPLGMQSLTFETTPA